MKYKMIVAECYESVYTVEADSVTDAIKQFHSGNAEYENDSLEYVDIDYACGQDGLLAVIDEQGKKIRHVDFDEINDESESYDSNGED